MPDRQAAYSLAVQLHQELLIHEHHYPQLKSAIRMADELAREMGWEWVNQC